MERLNFNFAGGTAPRGSRRHALVGVVASGNLEVLIESLDLGGQMQVEVLTTVRGFDAIWAAVVEDFARRHPLSDVRVAINDVGATPAVVGLRLDQAVEALELEKGE